MFRFRHQLPIYDTTMMIHLRSSLSVPPDAIHAAPFPATLTTRALYSSSLQWFEACACTPTPRGQTLINGKVTHDSQSFGASCSRHTSIPLVWAKIAYRHQKQSRHMGARLYANRSSAKGRLLISAFRTGALYLRVTSGDANTLHLSSDANQNCSTALLSVGPSTDTSDGPTLYFSYCFARTQKHRLSIETNN